MTTQVIITVPFRLERDRREFRERLIEVAQRFIDVRYPGNDRKIIARMGDDIISTVKP